MKSHDAFKRYIADWIERRRQQSTAAKVEQRDKRILRGTIPINIRIAEVPDEVEAEKQKRRVFIKQLQREYTPEHKKGVSRLVKEYIDTLEGVRNHTTLDYFGGEFFGEKE